jgi:GAF domain-containing protein
LSSAAKKLDDDQTPEAGNAPSERELKFSKNFGDPGLAELINGLGAQPEPVSLIEETAQAVHELVHENSAIDLGDGFENLPIPEEALEHHVSGYTAGPSALPQTTNSGPDPLERSLVMGFPGVVQPEPEDASGPRALPLSVNPEVDLLDRSLLLQVPSESVEDHPSLISVESEALQSGQFAALFTMSDRLFDLVACEHTFDEVVEAGMRAIMLGVNAHAASVLELDHEREDFFFRASAGGTSVEQLKAFRVPLTKGIVGHVAESGQSLLIRDLSEDAMQIRAISLSVGFEAKTCMAAPILVGGQPYGVMEVFNRQDGGHFDEKDLRTLEDGVRMFSKVLEVRFLLAELSRRAG